jgi:hypothetical protein
MGFFIRCVLTVIVWTIFSYFFDKIFGDIFDKIFGDIWDQLTFNFKWS